VFRAVLDANVYISAAIRSEGSPGQIIEGFLRKSAFELVVSPAIVDEVLRGLRYPKVTKYIRSEIEPEAWFLGIALLADLVAGDYVLSRVMQAKLKAVKIELRHRMHLSVSNSSSGCDWELDQVPAVGDPPHMVQIGSGHRLSTADGQWRVALQ
jgi:PIN domain